MKQALYIAGPECFYRNGTAQLEAMRREAEACGYDVTLPNDTPLDLGHEDLRRNADAIFRNCADSMDRSTAILCDLAFYRGPEPDGGSIYELGMAYARGISCYGYTRDKRAMCWKYQGSTLRDGQLFDRKNRPLPYASLPFSPNVVGAVKIVEGGFSDCLALFRVDEEETRKHGSAVPVPPPEEEAHEKPVLYLAGPQRWDASPDYREAADVGRACGFEVITPLDDWEPCAADEDPYRWAYRTLLRNARHVRRCDVLLADLRDFHGWEPESDTAFECGMAFQWGKRMYGWVPDARPMRQRIPNLGPEQAWRDACGCNVENFDYPLNLMFSSSMPISDEPLELLVRRIARELHLM